MKNLMMTLMAVLAAVSVSALAGDDAPKDGVDGEGYLREWLVLAPIPLADGQGGAEALAQKQLKGEADLKPKAADKVTVSGKELAWKEIQAKDQVLDFNGVLGQPTENSVGYAVTYLVAGADIDNLTLYVGSDDQVKVYLNGKMIHASDEPRPFEKDEDTVASLSLKKGLNVLVVKVVNEQEDWLAERAVSRRSRQAGHHAQGDDQARLADFPDDCQLRTCTSSVWALSPAGRVNWSGATVANLVRGDGFGLLSPSDVGLKPRHAHGLPLLVPHGQSPGENPTVSTVLVQHTVFAFKLRRLAGEVIGDLLANTIDVLRAHAIKPLKRAFADLVVFVAEHCLPARGVVDPIGRQVPVPQTIVGSADGVRTVPRFCALRRAFGSGGPPGPWHSGSSAPVVARRTVP